MTASPIQFGQKTAIRIQLSPDSRQREMSSLPSCIRCDLSTMMFRNPPGLRYACASDQKLTPRAADGSGDNRSFPSYTLFVIPGVHSDDKLRPLHNRVLR